MSKGFEEFRKVGRDGFEISLRDRNEAASKKPQHDAFGLGAD
jgi:hypothetical protein